MKGEKALHTCDNSTGTESGDKKCTLSFECATKSIPCTILHDLDAMAVNPKKKFEL